MMLRNFFLYLMAVVYILAGCNHFLNEDTYLRIMPHYLPWHLPLVYISGACEVLLGLLLLFPATRSTAAWLLIFLLMAVFPANIQMAVNFYKAQNTLLWVAVIRLPLQLLLIYWAWLYTRKKRY